MKTILITGCSSGFGLDAAKHFLAREWNVVATMRTPNDALPKSDRLEVLPLDITNEKSIRAAVEAAGPIDVLVNNAGIGWLNAVEGTPAKVTRELFETNTFGPIALIQAVLPQFRARKSGVIINVSSAVTLRSLPLLSVYTASKAALNAFTESAALEWKAFGIRAHVVLPGRAPTTRFGDNARARMTGFPEPYADLVKQVFERWENDKSPLTESRDVSEAIWRAATDPATPMKIAAGADANAMM
jgi:NAD(P)-dependent dehydrogenase (short-subunit alcohol dehydrogenase family)